MDSNSPARTTAPATATPPTPPTAAGPIEPAKANPMETYHTVADTIGGVPNLRWKDNVFQIVVVVVFSIVGLLVGWKVDFGKQAGPVMQEFGWGIGLVSGLIVGTVASGLVLMVVGMVRSAKKLGK